MIGQLEGGMSRLDVLLAYRVWCVREGLRDRSFVAVSGALVLTLGGKESGLPLIVKGESRFRGWN